MVVHAIASKACELLVLRAKFLEQLAHLHLAHLRRQIVGALEADAVRNLSIESVEVFNPHFLHHCLQIFLSMRKILVIHNYSFVLGTD